MNKLIAAVLAMASSVAAAQSYPTKPIRVVVPFAPGGPVDVVARLVQPKMQDLLGQPLIIENKAGAGGNLGVSQVARSPADGYTVLMTSSSFAVNATLTPDPGYNAEKDFISIAVIGAQPNFIVVNAGFPAKSLAELLQMAKTQKLAYASPSSGTTPHLTAENLFRVRAKVDITHIPFKGAGPAAAAVAAGEPPIGSMAGTAPIPFLKSGKMRVLAVSSSKRLPSLPDVPTLGELGFADMEDYTWVGLFVPAATPMDIAQKLNDAVLKTVQDPVVHERMDGLTFEITAAPLRPTADYVRKEIVKWAQVVRDTGAKAE
ncbi:MAG: tripartite tricarboxylate transporter substrate binding protein [Betaproteobacteria bacterium]|nr:tripartite tricarboxylate transporter substrate binding protein [Betaproteobacteria bacterium]MBV9361218.1 tripartite tricarboxylate transporter substrate binding protein [Betaproteobacteria bacterium]